MPKAPVLLLLQFFFLFSSFFLLSSLLPTAPIRVAADTVENLQMDVKRLRKFVDELPDMPRVSTYTFRNGVPVTKPLTIGMFHKTWRLHSDLPPTRVFAYGTNPDSATVPGPTIESLRGVESRVTWENHLPGSHILPWDPTLSTAKLPPGAAPGVPTVVHLHGAVAAPESDGNSMAWFTNGFNATGPAWTRKEYVYPNVQTAGNLWYHDHAMGLTRVNLLAGLVGPYVIRDPEMEAPLGLPSGPEFDRHLVVFDRSFAKDGSIYMNPKGNNPSIHPQWQPEYFGDAIVVNGKVWPVMKVQRRMYRFRIINASNARFFRFYFLLPNNSTGRLRFIHIGSDNAYLPGPAATSRFLLAPSEIADVIVDFGRTNATEAILANNAAYPFPKGDDPIDEATNGRVMKFVIQGKQQSPPSAAAATTQLPRRLMQFPEANPKTATPGKRRIVMYEYATPEPEDQPTHLYLNGKPFTAPATETPRPGTTELWDIINLTDDNHPFHIHLAHFVVLEQRTLLRVDQLKDCMNRTNDAVKCQVDARHAVGLVRPVPRHERGWKNVFKMRPSFVTRILVRFALLAPLPDNVHGANRSLSSPSFDYPFDPTAEPGYVYHCHILDHEDNEMMRPLKLVA